MDIFSAGCVIAELFLETPIFDLSQMYKYKKGEFDPVSFHLRRIEDVHVRELVAHMIQVEPEARYSAEQYLNFFRQKVFPEYFYSFLHQYMSLVTDPSSGRSPVSGTMTNLGESDERIDRIYYDFDKISYFLGYNNDKEAPREVSGPLASLRLLPIQLNIPNNQHRAAVVLKRPSDDGTLIFLTLVVSSLRSTARAIGRVRACDLLVAFSERLTDEAKLDRVLPYLVALLSDDADMVKIAAIRSLTQLLALVTVISPVNANIFPEYILKRTRDFLIGSEKLPSPAVRATYASCLGSLATTASRFLDMVATLRADGTLPTTDLEVEENEATLSNAGYHELFDNARAELVELFENHTKALITDRSSSVRRAFLTSVPELCMFFGTADANDIILTHLNTYLNDRDWMLKCAFFDNIVGVATYLGGTSLEEFILPLMVQALSDAEEFVVERVLRSLASMAELGLFQRSTTWELVDIIGRFTMHPNYWIRESAAMFLSASTKFLSKADNYCIILPLIRPYLKSAVRDFSELELLDNLKRPLSRSVLELAATWASRSDRGVFWKSVKQLRTFMIGAGPQIKPTMVTKDLSQAALKQVAHNDEDDLWLEKLRAIGMSSEDEFKLIALREHIWRIAPQKARDDNVLQNGELNTIMKLQKYGISLQTIMFDDKHNLEEPLRSIKPELENGERGHTIVDALMDASMSIDDPTARRKRTAINSHRARISNQTGLTGLSSVDSRLGSPLASSPISPAEAASTPPNAPRASAVKDTNSTGLGGDDDASSLADTISSAQKLGSGRQIRHKSSAISLLHARTSTGKSLAQTATTADNAFGKVEGPFTQPAHQPSALVLAKDQKEAARANDQELRTPHSYHGNDPSILHMLDKLYVDNYATDVREFGPLVQPISRHRAIARSGNQAADKPWHPEGNLVATFSEHTGSINRIVVAPNHTFFLTGGDDDTVRVWDTARLERNIAHRSRQTHKQGNDCKITSLCFVENTHCFVSTGSDGSVNVVKVEYLHGSAGSTGRYGKLRLLREYQLPEGEFTLWSDHYRLETNSILMLATNRSRILAIDLRSMNIMYVLLNPIHHGTPTCFVVDRKRHWLLLGTSHGILDFWDLRFKVRIKGWGLPSATSIYRIVLHPFKGRGKWVCVSGGSGAGEITVWDVEKMQCREVYRTAGSGHQSQKDDSLRRYETWNVDDDRPEGMLSRFATALDPSTSSSSLDKGVKAMVAGSESQEDGRDTKYGFLVTGGSDRRIRFWDLAHVENSTVVSGLDVEETKPTFLSSHPTATLTVNTEKVARNTPTAPNAGVGKTGGGTTGVAGRTPRSTVMSLAQQQLLKSHLDSVTDVALLESPYGMTVSVDRSGCIYVFQ